MTDFLEKFQSMICTNRFHERIMKFSTYSNLLGKNSRNIFFPRLEVIKTTKVKVKSHLHYPQIELVPQKVSKKRLSTRVLGQYRKSINPYASTRNRLLSIPFHPHSRKTLSYQRCVSQRLHSLTLGTRARVIEARGARQLI